MRSLLARWFFRELWPRLFGLRFRLSAPGGRQHRRRIAERAETRPSFGPGQSTKSRPDLGVSDRGLQCAGQVVTHRRRRLSHIGCFECGSSEFVDELVLLGRQVPDTVAVHRSVRGAQAVTQVGQALFGVLMQEWSRLTIHAAVVGLRAAEIRWAAAASPRCLAAAANLVRCAVKASGCTQYRLSSSSSAMTP